MVKNIGFVPIQILGELRTQKYLSNIENLNPNDFEYKKLFQEAQFKFTKRFDYFVGASIGGLTAFCLAMNYNILDTNDIYSNPSYYFKRNYLGPLFYSKYNSWIIHKKLMKLLIQLNYQMEKIYQLKMLLYLMSEIY